MLFSRKDLLKMTIPMLVQHVMSLTLVTVDTMMVAAAGEAAVSGVSLVANLDITLALIFFSVINGGTVVVAQMMGTRDMERTRHTAKQLLFLSCIMAAAVTVFSVMLGRPILKLLFGAAELEVLASAQEYFFFMCLSYPFCAIQSACNSILRVEGKTTAAMLVDVSANLLNVGGNALLILGLHMGAAGAAISTLVARVFAAIIMLRVIRSPRNTLYIQDLLHYRPNKQIIRKILRIGIPGGVEDAVFSAGKLVTQTLVAAMPTPVIAANAVALTLVNYQYMPGNILTQVMLPVVGRCLGAEKQDDAKYYTRLLTLICYGCIWIIALVLFLLFTPLIGAFDLSPESAHTAKELVFAHALVAGILWPPAFTLPGAFRAAGDVKFSMVVSLLSMWTFRVGLAWLLCHLGLGIWSIWTTMFADWICRSIFYVVHYRKEHWLKQKAELY